VVHNRDARFTTGSEETGQCILVATRKKLKAKEHDAEAGKAFGTWKTHPTDLKNGVIPCSVTLLHSAYSRTKRLAL
jgi:hypothetical protein